MSVDLCNYFNKFNEGGNQFFLSKSIVSTHFIQSIIMIILSSQPELEREKEDDDGQGEEELIKSNKPPVNR